MSRSNNQSKCTSSPPLVNVEAQSTTNSKDLTDNEFQAFKFIDDANEIITKIKRIYPVNKKLLLNWWVLPCVCLNDDLYVIDQYNYHAHYSIFLQKDIIKPTNYMEDCKNIQIRLALEKNSSFQFLHSNTTKYLMLLIFVPAIFTNAEYSMHIVIIQWIKMMT